MLHVTRKKFTPIFFSYSFIFGTSFIFALLFFLLNNNGKNRFVSEGLLLVNYSKSYHFSHNTKNNFIDTFRDYIYADDFTDTIIKSLNRSILFQLVQEYQKTSQPYVNYSISDTYRSFFNGLKKLHIDKDILHYKFSSHSFDVTQEVSFKIKNAILEYIDKYNTLHNHDNGDTHEQNKDKITQDIKTLQNDILVLRQSQQENVKQKSKNQNNYKKRYSNIDKYIKTTLDYAKKHGLLEIAPRLNDTDLNFYTNRIKHYNTLIQQQYYAPVQNQVLIYALKAKNYKNVTKAQKRFSVIIDDLRKKSKELKQKYTKHITANQIPQSTFDSLAEEKYPLFKNISQTDKIKYIEKLQADIEDKHNKLKLLKNSHKTITQRHKNPFITVSWKKKPHEIYAVSNSFSLIHTAIVFIIIAITGLLLRRQILSYMQPIYLNVKNHDSTKHEDLVHPASLTVPEYQYKHNNATNNLALEILMLHKTHSFKQAITDLSQYIIQKRYEFGQTIFMTASENNVGLTQIASCIARVLAKEDHKVLLIELSETHNGFKETFNLTQNKGLTHFLFDHRPLSKIMSKDPLTHLHLITYGDKNHSIKRSLQSKMLQDIIKRLKKTYQYIIIDAGVTSGFDHIACVSTLTDSKIIVTNAQNYNKNKIHFLVEALENKNTHAKPHIIFNKVCHSEF